MDAVQEEKKRGRRLFGGLLNTLSQTTPTGQQKRRQDIEKRQAEKAKQQKIDADIRKAERLEKLKVVRVEEQIKFDEKSVSLPPIPPRDGKGFRLIMNTDANTTHEFTSHGKLPLNESRAKIGTCSENVAFTTLTYAFSTTNHGNYCLLRQSA